LWRVRRKIASDTSSADAPGASGRGDGCEFVSGDGFAGRPRRGAR
jgi:hypothetical protein